MSRRPLIATTLAAVGLLLAACTGTPSGDVTTATETTVADGATPETVTVTSTPGPGSELDPGTLDRLRSRESDEGQGGGLSPERVTVTETAPRSPHDDTQIYHNSSDWRWLAAPGKIVPGGQIINVTGDTLCSTGWITGVDDRFFILTAGHCGAVGDQFAIRDAGGNAELFGEMVESHLTGNHESISGADIGLIEIHRREFIDPVLPLAQQVAGWQSLAWVEGNQPQICRLGHRTGLTCGPYLEAGNEGLFSSRGILDQGDSGGPVFARTSDGELWAVGVASYRVDTNATHAGSMSISEWMQHWGLTIYTH